MSIDNLLPETPRVYDYLVDFFGILIPGMTFVFISTPIVAGIGCIVIFYNIPLEKRYVSFFYDFKFEITIFLFIFSYILGMLFFRRGTKKVDTKSVKKVWKDIKNDGPISIANKKNAEWPYDNLKLYLQNRLPYLAKLIPWDCKSCEYYGPKNASKSKFKLLISIIFKGGKIQEQPVGFFMGGQQKICMGFQRSKTFMNILKSNIRFHHPDKYFTIARNEAHVRLSSSIWYVFNIILIISLISLSIAILFYSIENNWLYNLLEKKFASLIFTDKVLPFIKNTTPLSNLKIFIYRFYLFSCFIIIIISLFIKRSIKKVLYYQRIREIVFILNIAYQAFKINPEFGSEFVAQKIWLPLDIGDKANKLLPPEVYHS